MKTLLVTYLPGKRSRTRILLEAFCRDIAPLEVEVLDLCQDVPDLFSIDALEAYYARLNGEVPLKTPLPVLAKMDRMTAQLIATDVVVVVTPIHNFSLPATVKAWFDSVMLRGETFKGHPRGGYVGLMTDKKALILMTASGTYSIGDGAYGLFGPAWEHALSLAKLEFQFMGFSDIRGVLAESMARGEEVIARNLTGAIEQIHTITQEWYGDELLSKQADIIEDLTSASAESGSTV
jgi:FMN-dependent NADH-azoreductase